MTSLLVLASAAQVCDCFVCPSVTETFGQTVNEALASGVTVAVPRVGCFVEAYEGLLDSQTPMWTPGDMPGMAATILGQLQPAAAAEADGAEAAAPTSAPRKPMQLKSWEMATDELIAEYRKVDVARQRAMTTICRRLLKATALVLGYPALFFFTLVAAFAVFLLAQIRTALGGVGVRTYIRGKAKQIDGKAKQVLFTTREALDGVFAHAKGG